MISGGGLLGPSSRMDPRRQAMLQHGQRMMAPPTVQGGGGQPGMGGQGRRPSKSPQQAMMPFPYSYGKGY